MVYKLRMVFTFLRGWKENEEKEKRRREKKEDKKIAGRGRGEETAVTETVLGTTKSIFCLLLKKKFVHP